MKFIRIDTINTRYITAGDSPRDVVFIHGWAASSRMWLRTMWSLRHAYRTWALDLPGFGYSDAPSVDWYTITRYTDHVAAFCQTQGIEQAVVVGHSMGARIALDLAWRYPSQATQLVLIAPSVTGRLGYNLDLFLIGGVGQVLMKLSQWFWPLAALGAQSTYWTPRFLGDEGVKRTADDWQLSTWAATVGSLRAMVHEDFSPQLAQIQQPALIINGQRDYTIPPGDADLTAAALPHARQITFDHVHHWPMDEDRRAFMAALTSFLSDEQQAVPA